MKTSADGRDLIKRFEGLELEAYQDIAGVWTIGYGHTKTAGPNQTITQQQADDLLSDDLCSREAAIDDLVTVYLSQKEFDALVALVFNIGVKAFKKSTVLRLLNAGDRQGAANAFLMWTKATVNGVRREVLGLKKRRHAERALFLSAGSVQEEGLVEEPGYSGKEIE